MSERDTGKGGGLEKVETRRDRGFSAIAIPLREASRGSKEAETINKQMFSASLEHSP